MLQWVTFVKYIILLSKVTLAILVTKVQLPAIVLSLSCASPGRGSYCTHLPQNLGDRVGRGYEGLLFQPLVFGAGNAIRGKALRSGANWLVILPSPASSPLQVTREKPAKPFCA